MGVGVGGWCLVVLGFGGVMLWVVACWLGMTLLLVNINVCGWCVMVVCFLCCILGCVILICVYT